jgi:predicted outer membrane protein
MHPAGGAGAGAVGWRKNRNQFCARGEPSTADFVKEVAISDMFEIEASKLAQQKGNAAEKTFASQMVTDHTKPARN